MEKSFIFQFKLLAEIWCHWYDDSFGRKMKIRQFFYGSVFMMCCGCLESGYDSNDLVIENDINYLHPTLDMGEFPNNPYKILGITPQDDFFDVIVEYTGGCQEHRFYTWWDGNWSEATSPEGTFYLLHEDGGDACERVVRDTIKLDMNKVFNGTYPLQHTYVTVKNAYDGNAITVDPFLAEISNYSDCQLKASLENMLCVQGIWENKGLLLIDSIPGHEKVWIQPVKNNNDISLTIPSVGQYRIDVTPLFGFEQIAQDANCLGKPEGVVLPASINCIQKL